MPIETTTRAGTDEIPGNVNPYRPGIKTETRKDGLEPENTTITGTEGNDILGEIAKKNKIGGPTGETMTGGDGDDTYNVDLWRDEVIEHAGEGHDTVRSSITYQLPDNVEDLILDEMLYLDKDGYGNSLDNHIYGTSGENKLYGGSGHDELYGNAGNDHLYGGNNNDTLDGGLGADTMVGGDGRDTYYVDQIGDIVIEQYGQGADRIFSSISYTLGNHVEHLALTGSDNIDGAGNGLNNWLLGNDGNNMLFGYGGQDTLDGGKGADSMWGGEGDDDYVVDDAGDKVFEVKDHGKDHVTVTTDLDYVLPDHVEDLTLTQESNGTGNALDNAIYGSDFDNVIDGGLGVDCMQGNDGNDTYYVDNLADKIHEKAGEGQDVVFTSVDHTLSDHIEALSLAIGNAIHGTGNAQDNKIYGNTANNVLDGGDGVDQLNGLGGSDTFVFKAGEANGDSIYEFDGNGAGNGDVLQLVGYGTAAEGATIVWVSGDSWLITSDDGSIQETIHIIGSPNLDASDYVFV
jgi:Ca2+-binding RTX toxin-like protein